MRKLLRSDWLSRCTSFVSNLTIGAFGCIHGAGYPGWRLADGERDAEATLDVRQRRRFQLGGPAGARSRC